MLKEKELSDLREKLEDREEVIKMFQGGHLWLCSKVFQLKEEVKELHLVIESRCSLMEDKLISHNIL